MNVQAAGLLFLHKKTQLQDAPKIVILSFKIFHGGGLRYILLPMKMGEGGKWIPPPTPYPPRCLA